MNYNYSILLVDDDLMSLKSLQQFLRSEGHKVDAYDNPFDAMEAGKSNKYDIIAADYSMPGKNGMELLEEIIMYQVDAVTVLFTGYPTRELYNQISSSRIDLFYEKPITIHKFIEEISNIVNQKPITQPYQINNITEVL